MVGLSYWSKAAASAQVPAEGAKACPLTMTFPGGPFVFNQLETRALGFMSLIAMLFIDNSANDESVTVVAGVLGHSMTIDAGNQAFLPILCPQNATLTFSSSGTGVVGFDLVNTPLPAAVWASS